jgi:integrase/recombinase XerD
MERSIAREYVRREVQRFAEYLRAEKRTEATVKSYTRSLQGFLSGTPKTVRQLTKDDMQAWKGQLSGRYCENSMVPMIEAVNCYLVKVCERPDLKMVAPRWVEKDVIPLSESEVMAFLKEAHRPMLGLKGHKTFETCHRDYMMACLMYYGGLRASEVGNLRVSGLDLDRGMLRVCEGKEKDNSLILLHSEAVQAIKSYLKQSRSCIKPQAGYEDHLILTETGRPLARNQLWKIVKRIAIRTGIEKNVHPHIFRHTMATKMAEQGLNAFEIAAQTRHKNIDTVQKYIHISEGARRSAYDRAFSGTLQRAQPAQVQGPTPKPAPGPELYASQGSPQVIMMTPQQLQQVIQAAIGAAPKAPLTGYQ